MEEFEENKWKVSEYDQETPQSQTADQPTRPLGRATKHQRSQDIYGEVCALHRSNWVIEHDKTAGIVEIYSF